MQQIGPEELRGWMNAGKDFLLLDVREAYEHEHFNIGGRLLPLGELMANQNSINTEVPVVVYCEKGIRSVIAIQRLEGVGFSNLYNLAGGMKEWKSSLQPGL